MRRNGVEAARVVEVFPDGTLTRVNAALYLGISPNTLSQWAVYGYGPPFRRSEGRTYYRKTDLDAFIEERDGPSLL